MMTSGFNKADEKNLIQSDFFIKNVLNAYYSAEETPILKEDQIYKDYGVHKTLPKKTKPKLLAS